MSQLQTIVVVVACLLFVGLYFGGDTNPETQVAIEKTRAVRATSTSIESILPTAKSKLSADTSAMIMSIERELVASQTDSLKVGQLKKLAGLWYDAGRNVLVLTTLARLAIQTNQLEKAIERLNTAIRVEPDNKKANCLMVQAYDGLGNKEKAAQYAAKCID